MAARRASHPVDHVEPVSVPRDHSSDSSSLAVRAYLTHYANVSRSVSKYAGTYHRSGLLRRTETIIAKPLLSANVDDMRYWYSALAETNGPAAQRASLAGVRGFYQWCIEQDYLDRDPTRRLRAPRQPQRRPHPIAEADLARAIGSAEPTRVRPILTLAAFAGLRAHEIAGLHRRDVSGDQLTVVGKGDRERAVDLHPTVADVMSTLPETGWLFPRRDGTPGPIDAHRVSTIANEHLHACGVQLTLHSLRHRFATQLYLATHDLLLVQHLLGHASPTTTQIYTDFDRASSASAVASLPGLRGPG